MLTRAVVAAARAASAAAATSLITLRLPTGSRSSARSRIRDTSRTRASGGRAAPSVAASIAAERSADCAVVPLRQPVRLGYRCEGGRVVLGQGERLVAQLVRGVANLVHQLGVLGEPRPVAVPRDHGDECRGLRGVQRRGCSAAGCGHPVGERVQEALDRCRCAPVRPPLLPGPASREAGRSGGSRSAPGQRRIRAISGSTSGSAATVAAMRRPKYSISTAGPGGRARRQPRVGDGPADGVAEGGAGDVAGGPPVEEHRLVAEDDAAAVVDGEAGQPAGDGVGRQPGDRRRGRRTRPCPHAPRSRARPRTGCARWSCRGPRRGTPSPGAGC